MFLSLAVLLVGIWLVVDSQEPVSSTLTLIFGIIVAALALLALAWPYRARVRPPA